MKIYNDLTRKKEEFKPITEGQVGMYVCGPTVYGPPHLGHARSYVNFDVVKRYFDFLGNKTTYVQNITDVGHLTGDSDDGEDKILKQAKKEEINPYAIAYKYETEYFKQMDRLNVEKPTISCRATGFIPDIIDFIQILIDKNFAYVTKEGNVYFDISKDKDYGKMSGRKIENNLSGERIVVASDKKNPEDFALWKKAEKSHLMKWKSPWSVGFPGWHIECSVMSKKFLGETFDIHGGGIDNMFPHHESEIAQSECANGKPFVNYFMHNNLITVNGTKMGKSLGNSITLEHLMETYNPMWIRYFIIQFHYRSPVDFSEKAIKEAGEQFEKLNKAFNVLTEKTNGEEAKAIGSDDVKEIYDNFISAMNEDFNTPLATSELLKACKLVNTYAESNSLIELLELKKLFDDLAIKILGLKFDLKESSKNEIPQEVLSLALERKQARINKDFALSDELRNKILQLGFNIKDKPNNEFEITK